MPDILVTGLRGQLGSEIAALAAIAGISCRGTTRHELDIVDRAAVLRAVEEIRPAVIVNAAAYTAVDRAEGDAAAAFAVNRDGAANVAEACAAAGVPLIHISTDYVFDGHKTSPYTEEDAVGPLNIYGESKLAGETAIRQRTERQIILRTSWLYGIGGNNFVNTMLRLSRERNELRVVADQSGCPTFAGDLAEAILAIVRRLISHDAGRGIYGTFHCAGSGATTWFHLARKVLETALPASVERPTLTAIAASEYPAAARRPGYSVLDCGRLSDVYGLTLRSWEAALAEMLATAGAVGSNSEDS